MQFEKIVDLDLAHGRAATLDLGPMLYQDDINSIKLGVRLRNGSEPVEVEGDVVGRALLANGATIPIESGEKSGNEAWVIIPQAALEVPGRVEYFMRIYDTDTTAVALYAYGYVRRTTTGTIIVPGDPLPDVEQLRRIAADCETATETARGVVNTAVQYTAQTKTAAEQAQARVNIGAAGAEDLLRLTLPPFTRHVFQGVNRNFVVSTGANSRRATVLYNTIYSAGTNNTGSTFQNIVLTEDEPIRRYQPANANFVFVPAYFRQFTPFTSPNLRLIIRLKGYQSSLGATTNPPLLCVATYNPETMQVSWNAHDDDTGVPLGLYGYKEKAFAVSDCLANGNICIMVIFRRVVHTIDWTLEAEIVNITEQPWAADIPVETMVAQDKYVQTETTTTSETTT